MKTGRWITFSGAGYILLRSGSVEKELKLLAGATQLFGECGHSEKLPGSRLSDFGDTCSFPTMRKQG